MMDGMLSSESQRGQTEPRNLVPLNRLAVNVPAVIRSVQHTDSQLADTLQALGAVEGAAIEIARRGLFGGPIIVRIKRSHVAMRTSEASLIMVETSSSKMR
jgi:Fe2+ transport system protein FeoA